MGADGYLVKPVAKDDLLKNSASVLAACIVFGVAAGDPVFPFILGKLLSPNSGWQPSWKVMWWADKESQTCPRGRIEFQWRLDSAHLRLLRNFVVFELAFSIVYKHAMSMTARSGAPFWLPDSVLLCALLLSRPPDLVDLSRRTLACTPVRCPPSAPMWFLLAAFLNDSLKALVAAALLRRVLPRRAFRLSSRFLDLSGRRRRGRARCHYRKLRPDASKAVSINDTWRGQRVNRLPSHHRDVTGIENERRPDGSSPRRARSLDEKACFCLRKSVSAKRARRAR